MNNDQMPMGDGWMMYQPFGDLLTILFFTFLILGIAAFVKYLFFNKK